MQMYTPTRMHARIRLCTSHKDVLYQNLRHTKTLALTNPKLQQALYISNDEIFHKVKQSIILLTFGNILVVENLDKLLFQNF